MEACGSQGPGLARRATGWRLESCWQILKEHSFTFMKFDHQKALQTEGTLGEEIGDERKVWRNRIGRSKMAASESTKGWILEQRRRVRFGKELGKI